MRKERRLSKNSLRDGSTTTTANILQKNSLRDGSASLAKVYNQIRKLAYDLAFLFTMFRHSQQYHYYDL
jgi:hypothetical protein